MGCSGLELEVVVAMCWWLWKSVWLGLRPGLDMASNVLGDRRLMSRISTLPPVDL